MRESSSHCRRRESTDARAIGRRRHAARPRGLRVGLLGLAVLLALGSVKGHFRADAAPAGFVGQQGGRFVLNGRPFYFIGDNVYYLPIMASPGWGNTAAVDASVAMSTALGITVWRTWGFCDGTTDCPANLSWQPAPRQYNDVNLRGLDYVVDRASAAGIKLYITLVGTPASFHGGIPQILRWCGIDPSATPRFFQDPCPIGLVKDWITHLLTHTNYYTGRVYRDDPTIMAWELQAEIEFADWAGDPTGQVVADWVAMMAAHVKSIDPNHLVANGEQGWDVPAHASAYGSYPYPAWMFNGIKGVSFTKNTSVPLIDFGTIHVYPDTAWNTSDPHGLAPAFIKDHAAIARSLGKPLVIGETGYLDGAFGQTTASVLTTILGAADRENVAGAIYWMLQCANLCQGAGQDRAVQWPPDSAVSNALKSAAALMASKSILPPIAPANLTLR